MSQYYKYKTQDYTCKKCRWIGTGEQTEDGEIICGDSFEVNCPRCYNLLDIVIFPTLDEMLKYGTKDDKQRARVRQEFLNTVREKELKASVQLPDIDENEIIITLCEENSNIVLFWNDNEIWREIRTYEYYTRYLQLGEILKEKYGERLADFKTEYTLYLGGDSLSAFDEVRKFRKSLKKYNQER